MRALTAQARAAGDAVMPAYTHLQRAEPVLVAHWLQAYGEMLLRDMTRLGDLSRRLNYCPLGSGAVAGATLKLDRTIAARELGFSAPTANSMDATSDRDFALEFLQALTLVALHASRFAEEITLYATAEFGFVELPEAFSTGSSAMPQKKNPDLTELVRAKVARINGAAQTVTMLLKGLPLAYNKDLQESQEPLFCRGRFCGADDRAAGQVYRRSSLQHGSHAQRLRDRLSQRHGGRDLPRAQGCSLSQGARENWPGGALWSGKGLRTRWPYARGVEAVWAGVRSRFFFEHHPRCNRELPRRDWRHRGGPGA